MARSYFKINQFPKKSLNNIIQAKLKKIIKKNPNSERIIKKYLDSIFITRFQGLALDFDGTLIPLNDRYKSIESYILRKLILLNQQRIPIFILTGRGKSIFQQVPLNKFEDKKLLIIVQYNGGRIKFGNNELINEKKIIYIKNYSKVKEFLESNEVQYSEKVSGFVCQGSFEDNGLFDTISKKFRNWNVLNTKYSFDVLPSNISKGSALKDSCRLFPNLNKKSILKIGDSGDINGNDYSFLKMKNSFSVGDYTLDLRTNFPIIDENNINLIGPEGVKYLFSYLSL